MLIKSFKTSSTENRVSFGFIHRSQKTNQTNDLGVAQQESQPES